MHSKRHTSSRKRGNRVIVGSRMWSLLPHIRHVPVLVVAKPLVGYQCATGATVRGSLDHAAIRVSGRGDATWDAARVASRVVVVEVAAGGAVGVDSGHTAQRVVLVAQLVAVGVEHGLQLPCCTRIPRWTRTVRGVIVIVPRAAFGRELLGHSTKTIDRRTPSLRTA